MVVVVCIQFWIGAFVGLWIDYFQQYLGSVPSNEAERSKQRQAYAFQARHVLPRKHEACTHITIVVVVYTAAFLILQWLLNYLYRAIHCAVYKRVGHLSRDLDVHALHNGFAMGLGMAWTSGTTLAKMHAVLDHTSAMFAGVWIQHGTF